MGNAQEIQRPVALDTTEAQLDKEASEAVKAQGHEALTEQANKIIGKMAEIYTARLREGFTTDTDLRALSTSADTPKWKQRAARMALGIPEKEGSNLI